MTEASDKADREKTMLKFGMLFTSPLADAIHEGRKSVTRRLIMPQPHGAFMPVGSLDTDGDWRFVCHGDKGLVSEDDNQWIKPRYRPGMIVAVKETHWRYGRKIKTGHGHGLSFVPDLSLLTKYRFASPPCPEGKPTGLGWYRISGLFLPFDDARTHIEILDVRPERLQAMEQNPDDAFAEGVLPAKPVGWPRLTETTQWAYWHEALANFKKLWDSINDKKALWDSNPFVWRYFFKRVEKP